MTDTTRKSILALMPNGNGEPTHKAMKRMEKELGGNPIAVFYPFGHGKGHIRLLQAADIYFQRKRSSYLQPHLPLTIPPFLLEPTPPCVNSELLILIPAPVIAVAALAQP